MDVTACIVTKGDHPLDEILVSYPDTWRTYVYDNSVPGRPDMGVFGRYVAAKIGADTELVFVQDDDCVLPRESLLALQDAAEHADEDTLVANMPEPFRSHYFDSCLVGFGAMFRRDLPVRVFSQGGRRPEDYPNLHRECDAYFTAGCWPNHILLDLPYQNLPWATDPDRLYRQPEHGAARKAALDLARSWR